MKAALLFVLGMAGLVAGPGCREDAAPLGIPEEGGAGVLPAPILTADGAIVIGRGRWTVPAALYFHQPGFHFVVAATQDIPISVRVEPGWTLVVTLQAARPSLSCPFDHPLSGCPTIDWSDDPARSHTPESGVFRNTLTLPFDSGARSLALRAGGTFAETPGDFAGPDGAYTAIGTEAIVWAVPLPDGFSGGRVFRLDLVLTKFRGEPVDIVYEIRVEPPP